MVEVGIMMTGMVTAAAYLGEVTVMITHQGEAVMVTVIMAGKFLLFTDNMYFSTYICKRKYAAFTDKSQNGNG